MPRKYESLEHLLKPDPRFGNLLVAKFINCVMKQGKKTVAQGIVYGALDLVQKRLPGEDPVKVFQQAINNVRPMVEVRSRRVGGATYQVPVDVSSRRQQSLAFRWIIRSCRAERGKPMHMRLARELMDAFKGEGKAMSTRDQTHRMAEANKAFAHFAW